MDGGDEVCDTCEPSRQAAAEPEPIQSLRVTLAPPVKQPYLAPKSRSADFYDVRPGQSLEPFRALIRSRQYASGVSKRGTDSNKGFHILLFHSSTVFQVMSLKCPSPFITDWSKLATLGPLFLIPKQETTTQSTPSNPAEELELLFNLTETSPVMDELGFKTDQEGSGFEQ